MVQWALSIGVFALNIGLLSNIVQIVITWTSINWNITISTLLTSIGSLNLNREKSYQVPAEMASEHHFAVFKLCRHGKLELRVWVWTLLSGRTKPWQVVEAEDASNMSVSARWSVSAEPAVVPRTVSQLGLGVDVQERTLLVVTSIWNLGQASFKRLKLGFSPEIFSAPN